MSNLLHNSKLRCLRERFASSRSAQAAIFIVIALIVILSGVLYFFYQRQSVEQEVEIVQPEAAPVKLYVENCIKSVAQSGLERIGLNGGYINIPEDISGNEKAYLSAFPASGFKLPYWWHDGIEAVPSEEFIRLQLALHIEQEMKNCIGNFEPFANRFEVNELKQPIADVQFNENDVSVSLKYPIEVIGKDGSFRTMVEKFRYIVPIRFKKVYELARLIMERENNDFFFEKKTIDLISLDQSIPTTDVEATCKPKIWQLANVKEKLQTLLRVNLPYTRIKGSDYNPNLYVPNPSGKSVFSETYFQQHYVWEVDVDSEKKFGNMKVAFTYDNFPMEIFARPSQNGILRSNSQKGTDMLSFFCLHIWHFTYDISYPVMVSVHDKETGTNMAYQFNFAFMVDVNHNKPNRVNAGTTLFETTADLTSDDYCDDVQNEVTIFTVDNATGEDIRDVNLTFVCGRYYCGIGSSNWLSLGASAGITKRLPYCVNAVIKGSKGGYEDASSFIQTNVDGRSYVLPLNPIREFKSFRVVKHLLSNPGIASELSQSEKASILIKGKNTNFEGFTVYPKEADFPLRIPNEKDATYDVTIYLVDDENFLGGYIGEWKISKSELRNANEVVFHVIEQGAASENEKALFISGLSSYSKNVPSPELR